MNVEVIFDRTVAIATDLATALATSVSRTAHAAYDALSRMPTRHHGIAALVVGVSITVTLLTLYLRSRNAAVPARETIDAAAVRRLARQGLSTAEIARRTGLARDAVATILRAATLTRSNAIVADRKTRPTAARSAGRLKFAQRLK